MTWYSFLGLSSPQRVVFSDPNLDMRIRLAENSMYALFAEMTRLQQRLDATDKRLDDLTVRAPDRNSALNSIGPGMETLSVHSVRADVI